MTDKRKPEAPREIDDQQDRMGSVEPLDFEKSRKPAHAGDRVPDEQLRDEFPPRRVREAGMTGGEALGPDVHEDGITLDDLSPETLYDESGARSPDERGHGLPADEQLRIVEGDEIGAGLGLDEAELAQILPLDGEPDEPPDQQRDKAPIGDNPADRNPPRGDGKKKTP